MILLVVEVVTVTVGEEGGSGEIFGELDGAILAGQGFDPGSTDELVIGAELVGGGDDARFDRKEGVDGIKAGEGGMGSTFADVVLEGLREVSAGGFEVGVAEGGFGCGDSLRASVTWSLPMRARTRPR